MQTTRQGFVDEVDDDDDDDDGDGAKVYLMV